MTDQQVERQGGNIQAVPQEAVAIVDSLVPGSVWGTSDSSVIKFRLEYGSPEKKDELNRFANEQLGELTQQFITEMSEFIRVGQPNAANGIMPANYLDKPKEEIERPAYWKTSADLSGWLRIAQAETPEVADAAVASILEEIDNYDPIAFVTVIEAASSSKQGAVRHARWGLIEGLASKITSYTTDPALARQLLDSKLVAEHPSHPSVTNLLGHIVKQEGHTQPNGEPTDSYLKLLDRLDASFAEDKYISPSMVGVLWQVVERNPAQILVFTETYPQLAQQLREKTTEHLLGLDEEARTDAQRAVLATIESDIAGDIWEYSHLMRLYAKKDGTLSQERIDRLVGLLDANPDTHPERRLSAPAKLVCEHTPQSELPGLLAEKPHLVVDEGAKSIAIRRLAAEGAVQQALDLVDAPTTTIDSHRKIIAPIRNLLAIYEESGDEDAYARAKQRIKEHVTAKGAFVWSPDLHEFAVREFVAARKYGHKEREADAAARMIEGHTQSNDYERMQNLKLTLQTYLDAGDMPHAEHYALRVFNDPSLQGDENTLTKQSALLTVARKYNDAGQHVAAMNFLKDTLLRPDASGQLHYTAMYAIEELTGRHVDYLPSLYAAHINPLNSEYRE